MNTSEFNATTNTTYYVGETGQPNLAGLFVSNAPASEYISSWCFNCSNSKSYRMTLQLTETQRVAALRMSGQPGLNTDGTPCVVDINAKSLRDVALNTVLNNLE